MQADHLFYLYISYACFHYYFCQPGCHLINFLLNFHYSSPSFSFSVSRIVSIPHSLLICRSSRHCSCLWQCPFSLPLLLPPTPLSHTSVHPTPFLFFSTSLLLMGIFTWPNSPMSAHVSCLPFAVSSSCPLWLQWFILHFCSFIVLHGPAWQLQALPFIPHPSSGYMYSWQECHCLSPVYMWFLSQKLWWCTWQFCFSVLIPNPEFCLLSRTP